MGISNHARTLAASITSKHSQSPLCPHEVSAAQEFGAEKGNKRFRMGWGEQVAFLHEPVLTSHRRPTTCRGCHSPAGHWPCQQRVPTFAVLPIPSVAGLADALVGLGGVLADGIDVAVVSALHALVNICKRTGEGSKGESLGPVPPVPMVPPPQVMDPSSLWLLNLP